MELTNYRKTLLLHEQIEFDNFIKDFHQFAYFNKLLKQGSSLNDSTLTELFEEEMREHDISTVERRIANLEIVLYLEDLLNSESDKIWWCIDDPANPDNHDMGNVIYEVFIRTLNNEYTWIGAVLTHSCAEQIYDDLYKEEDDKKLGYQEYLELNSPRMLIVGQKGYSGKLTEALIKRGIHKFFLDTFGFDMVEKKTRLQFDPAANFLKSDSEEAEFVEEGTKYLQHQLSEILNNRGDYDKDGKKRSLSPEDKHANPVHTLFLCDADRLKVANMIKYLPKKMKDVDKLKRVKSSRMALDFDKSRPFGQVFIFDIDSTEEGEYYRFVGFQGFQKPDGWNFEFDPEAISWVFHGKFRTIST